MINENGGKPHRMSIADADADARCMQQKAE
jgi:hypothetical protein